MKLLPRILTATALVVSLGALAQDKATPGVAGASVVKVSATVVAIDQANRIVTLKGQNGDVSVLKIGPQVKNLAQVKVGDVVTSEYIRAVALQLKKGGDGIRSSTQQQNQVTAKPGEKPAGGVEKQTVVVANVVAVDDKNATVSVRGPEGNVIELHVPDPAVRAQVKVGDQVEATFTEAVIVAVTPPAKK